MRKNIMMRFSTFRSKLISVFALITLIPTVTLVFVAHLIIVQSIDRWERVSSKLRELSVLPMEDNAIEIASDLALIRALEDDMDLSELDFGLPEDYIVAIYDAAGEQLFNTSDEPILKEKLSSLEVAGLPPINEFRPQEPIFPREIKMRK